jgi:hypothetical protein
VASPQKEPINEMPTIDTPSRTNSFAKVRIRCPLTGWNVEFEGKLSKQLAACAAGHRRSMCLLLTVQGIRLQGDKSQKSRGEMTKGRGGAGYPVGFMFPDVPVRQWAFESAASAAVPARVGSRAVSGRHRRGPADVLGFLRRRARHNVIATRELPWLVRGPMWRQAASRRREKSSGRE